MRILILVLLLCPALTHAAVTINEVAWMGSAESANHEWIELHNDGSNTVDVTGWTLTDGMNLTIELPGSIAAGEYVVLERTSEASAPGTAFLIYTGALVNTGATLSLRRSNGGLEDQVGGGEDWENIGGDNVTKETAQYTTSGWVTGPATTGRSNVTAGSAPAEPEDDTDTADTTPSVSSGSSSSRPASSSSGNRSEKLLLTLPDVTLAIDVQAPSVAYVNQSVEFTAEPSGIGEALMNSLSYEWSFGDLHGAKGEQVAHRFLYPGTYLVTVHGHYKRQTYVGRHEITVLPVTVSLTRNSSGDVQLNNDAPYEIDLSNYQVVGLHTLTIPNNTILLPNQTITIPSYRVGAPVTLHDDEGNEVRREGSTTVLNTATPAPLQQAIREAPAAASVSFGAASPTDATETEDLPITSDSIPEIITIPAAEAAEADATAASNPTQPANPRWPYAVLAVILGIVSLGLLLRPANIHTR